MALEKQNVSLTLNKGINVKTDNKQSVPGELLTLENGIFKTVNEIRKRNGYDPLSTNINTGGDISVAIAASTFKNEILEFTGTEAYSYSESNNNWVDKGSIVQANVTAKSVSQSFYSNRNQDSAYHEDSSLSLIAWESSLPSGYQGIYYSIVDKETGNLIVNSVRVSSTSIRVKCFTIGSSFVLFYYDGVSALKFIVIPTGSPASPSSPVTFASDINATNYFYDGCKANGTLYIAYNTSDSGASIAVKTLNSAFLISNKFVIVAGNGATKCITIFTNNAGTLFWMCYSNGSAINSVVFNTSFIIIASAEVESISGVRNISGYADTTIGTIIYEVYSAPSTFRDVTWGLFCKTRKNTMAAPGGAGTAVDFVFSIGIASKWFLYNGVRYVVLTYQSYGTLAFNGFLGPQNTYFIVNSNAVAIGKALSLQGGGLTGSVGVSTNIAAQLAEINQVDDNSFYLGLLNQPTQAQGDYITYGATLTGINFLSNQNYISSEMGNNLHLSGSIVKMYDGQSLVEHGFNLFPLPVVASTLARSGHMIDGTYIWKCCYAWKDAAGQTHRSAMSDASSSVSTYTISTGFTDNSLTLNLSLLPLTQKGAYEIEVYRSDNGAPFCLCAVAYISAGLIDYSVSISDITLSVVGNLQSYDTGNVVENDPLPATGVMTTFKSRIVGFPSENPYQFWYSKQVVPGFPVEFSQEFVQNVNTRNKPATASIQMDDKLIIWNESNIFFIVGDGPSDNGSQNDFSQAQIISSDTGCINPLSPVLFPGGVIYESLKGRYLLDRSLQVSYIGAPVESYNDLTTISAKLIPNTTQVRIILEDGTCLVYDYFINQWSVFTNHSAVSAVNFQNKFTIIRGNGQALVESDSVFTDNGSFIKLKIVTNWIEFAGVQGFQRLRKMMFLGEYVSPHKLQVDFAYDFDSTISQQTVIDVNSLNPYEVYGESTPYGADAVYGGEFPGEQFRIFTTRQKCDAIQITIEDIQVGMPGESLSISNISFEVGVKRGLNKLPSARSVG